MEEHLQRMNVPMRHITVYLAASVCLILLHGSLSAQPLRFSHLDSREGLPQRTVTCLLQDSRGFIWAGTQEGLCRYDGKQFRVYRQSSGPVPTLSDDYILSLFEDDAGNIWVGTLHGLCRLDPQTERWTQYYHQRDNENSLSSDRVRALYGTADGQLWIATARGLNRMRRDGRIEKISLPPGENTAPARLQCLTGDADGTLWIGTGGGGLIALNTASGSTVEYRAADRALPDDDIRALAFDANGRLWIGTAAGGALRSPNGVFQALPHEGDAPVIAALQSDGAGGMWLGLDGDGLELWSAHPRRVSVYRHSEGLPTSLSSDRVSNLLRDASGNIWVGTYDGGLDHCHPRTLQFRHLRDIGGPGAQQDARMVWGMTTGADGALWIATNDGIHISGRQRRTWQHIGENMLPDVRTLCLLTDRQGRVWAGTQAGLHLFAVEDSRVRKLPLPFDATDGLRIMALHEGGNGVIWIGAESGLFAHDPARGTLTHYLDRERTQMGPGPVQPLCILEGRDGRIWVGSNGEGLFRLNPADGQTERYARAPGGLAASSVSSIYRSADGALWMGTIGGGLQRLDPRDMHFTTLTEEDGLANNTVYGVLGDAEGRLWISSNRGITRYDPRTRAFTNFVAADGLQEDEFNLGAYANDAEGRMYFGGGNGLNEFYPLDIKCNTQPPRVVITGMRAWAAGHGTRNFLPQGTGEARVLTHDESVITVEFAALEFSDPARNAYSWKLEGLQDDWVDSSHVRFAMFTGLPPGDYTFMLRASNNHGVWSADTAELAFSISPPWYGSWWFRTLMLLIAIAFILLLFRSRMQAARKHARNLEDQLQRRTGELQAHRDELQEKVAALDEARSTLRSTQAKLTYASKMASLGEMTAGIAHEIKNPINFVNNFAFSSVDIADELKEELEKGEDENTPLAERIAPLLEELVTSARKISEHGARVDRIVQSMLLHSHGKAGEAEAVVLNEFLDQYVTLAFHGMRAQVQNFTVTILREFDEAVGQVPMIRQDLARVFVNLLNNAFQAVSERSSDADGSYEPTVRVRTRRDDGNAVVMIEDNGRGVPEKLREKIFEPFFTTKTAGTGTGLGLSLSYEIVVDGHGGSLRYERAELGGACFIITLPAK
jgi:ligand-binding sensor domain-containing protein/signal transduction histidine kinase